MTLELDCRSCGACCKAHPKYHQKHESYVKIYDQDMDRLTEEQRKSFTISLPIASSEAAGYNLSENWTQRGAMRLVAEDKRCAALSGDIGGCVSCRIYDNRPSICSGFEKDGDLCHLAREEAGLGPFGIL